MPTRVHAWQDGISLTSRAGLYSRGAHPSRLWVVPCLIDASDFSVRVTALSTLTTLTTLGDHGPMLAGRKSGQESGTTLSTLRALRSLTKEPKGFKTTLGGQRWHAKLCVGERALATRQHGGPRTWMLTAATEKAARSLPACHHKNEVRECGEVWSTA